MYKKLLVIFLSIILLMVVILLKTNKTLNIFDPTVSSVELTPESIFVISQQGTQLYLELYSNNLDTIQKLYFTKTDQDFVVPTMISYVDNGKILITVGNYEGKQTQIFTYDGNKINKYGQIESSNPNVLVANNKLYAYRRDDTKTATFWIDVYNIDNLNKIINSIEIPDAPKKIVYSKYNNSLYLLFVGGTPVSSIGKYALDKNTLLVEKLDEKSFAGDILVDGEKVLVSMMGYSKDGKDSIEDNRLLVLNENIKIEKVITTANSPNLISADGNDIYVTVGAQKIAVDKLSLNSEKSEKHLEINKLGYPLAIKTMNSRLYILDSGSIYSIDEQGECSKKELSGETLSLWQEG